MKDTTMATTVISAPKRTGRKRVPRNLRLGPALDATLVAAAKENGLDVTRQLEIVATLGLERSYQLDTLLGLTFGPQLAAVLLAIGRAMVACGPIAATVSSLSQKQLRIDGNWLDDAYARTLMVEAAEAVLAPLRPKSDEKVPYPLLYGEQPGVELAQTLLENLARGKAQEALTALIEKVETGPVLRARIADFLNPPRKSPTGARKRTTA